LYYFSSLHYLYSAFILRSFTVRVHAGLVVAAEQYVKLHPASLRQVASGSFLKFWYVLRALDIEGSGYWRGSIQGLTLLTGMKTSTIYQHLREGKIVGAFRRWRCQRGELRVALGSLNKLAKSLSLGKDGWRPVGEVPLAQLLEVGIRAIATGITLQKQQMQARYAAWANLPPGIRDKYKLPYPESFFKSEAASSSHDLPTRLGFRSRRGLKCVAHIGPKRIFTTAGFIPQGVSQPTVARSRGRCTRTIQNHLTRLGIDRRQIVQCRASYEMVAMGLRFEMDCEPAQNLKLLHARNGSGVLLEQPGTVGKERVYSVSENRLFSYGGRYWIYRCNLYNPIFPLKTMRASFREYCQQLQAVENGVASVKGDGFTKFHQLADKERKKS
jgi:hypothetical protein